MPDQGVNERDVISTVRTKLTGVWVVVLLDRSGGNGAVDMTVFESGWGPVSSTATAPVLSVGRMSGVPGLDFCLIRLLIRSNMFDSKRDVDCIVEMERRSQY